MILGGMPGSKEVMDSFRWDSRRTDEEEVVDLIVDLIADLYDR